MSDITGPPPPKPVTPHGHGTDKLARASKDPNQTPRQATDDSGENRSKSEQREARHVREPAVSISATAAHLRVGEEVRQQVQSIDVEGRPIIVTENATFALHPSAGLKPGDDVILQVAEAGKQVSADLLRRNGLVIDPPVRLALIVIAIHAATAAAPADPQALPTQENVNYRATARSANTEFFAQKQPVTTDTEALATLLSRASPTQISTSSATAIADNPDPLARSNSSDLATLIAAQQSNPAGSGGSASPANSASGQPSNIGQQSQSAASTQQAASVSTVLAPSLNNTATAAGRLIPSNPLTESPITAPTGPQFSALTPPTIGLGPAIAGITLNGKPVQIQLLDLSISQVSPSEVADVKSVQPLQPNLARNLPIGLRAFGNAALARVESDKGTFIVDQRSANTLVGETIRFSSPVPTISEAIGLPDAQSGTQNSVQSGVQNSAQSSVQNSAIVGNSETPANNAISAPAQPEIPTYNARLTSPGSTESRAVQVQFIPQTDVASIASNTSQSHILTKVDTVQTLRAFLTGTGPRADLRLSTSFGGLIVTLPAGMRPANGNTIAILPVSTPANTALATGVLETSSLLGGATDTAASMSPAVANQGGDTAALSQLATASTWSSLEQVAGLLEATTAAGGLAARSAQGGGKLLNSMMFMMAALKGGTPSHWLGKTIEGALANKNTNLLQLLKGELSRIFNAGSDTTSEWRSLVLPFDIRGGEVPLMAALFSQNTQIDPDAHQGDDSETDKEKESQRFVIEVQFSVLGPLQLDGVVRGNKFDLVLWSENALPNGLIADTSELFNNALAANGFAGGLRFRHGETFPVDVASVLKQQLAA